MTKRPILHMEMVVADRDEAVEFYQQLFDWRFKNYPAQNYIAFNTNTISGTLNTEADELGAAGSVLIYVASDNIDADLNRAEELGGEVIIPRTPIPGVGWMGIFADPAGNHIGLMQIT